MTDFQRFEVANRGVSEVVGFVIVFSLILGTIAIVYTGGFSGLTDARDVEEVNNAERAFDVLGSSLEKMARGQAPHRATELKLSDSQLILGDLRHASVHNSTGDLVGEMPQNRPIIYEVNQDSKIVYEHGAVIRVDDGAATMQRKPDFIFGEDRTVIRHIETANLPTGRQNVGGDRTVLVRSSVISSELLYTGDESGSVTFALNTTSERAGAWERYLESEGGDCDPPIGNGEEVTLECDFETDRLYVAKTRIEIRFS